MRQFSAHTSDTDNFMFGMLVMGNNRHVEWLIKQEMQRDSDDVMADLERESALLDWPDAEPCGNIMYDD